MASKKEKSSLSKQLRCISFGGDTFKFEGYIPLPKADDNSSTYDIGSIKDFKDLKDNSICSVKFIYTLERMGNDADVKENFVSIMRELHRVCANGALVEIKTAHADFVKSVNDPLVVRTIDESLVKMLDASWRKQLSHDLSLVHTLSSLDKSADGKASCVDFMLLKAVSHLSPAAISKVEGKQYQSQADMLRDLSSVNCPFIANTYYLACRKHAGDDFALVQIPQIQSIKCADAAAYNASLEAGIRGCDCNPYVMQIYNTDNDKSNYVSKHLKLYGHRELAESIMFTKIMSIFAAKYDKFKFANIGANIGWYTILAPKVTSHVHVDSFEPTPESFEYLTNNIKLNQLEDRITPVNMALSDSKGEFDFFLNSDNPGNNAFVPYEENAKLFGSEFTKISVKADTLDSFYAQKDQSEWPNLILIDVEGHEQKVFDGASKLFEAGFRPMIISEFCPAFLALRGETTYYRDLLNKYNYSVFNIVNDFERPVHQVNLEYLDNVYAQLSKQTGDVSFLNLLFVPDYFDTSSGTLAFRN